MMKRIISVIFMVAVLLDSVLGNEYFSAVSPAAGAEWNNVINNIVISIMPFSGANNVNMRSYNYPQRENGTTLNYQKTALSEITQGSSLYTDAHMVAMGGVEGVPNGYYTIENVKTDFRKHEAPDGFWRDEWEVYRGENKPLYRIVFIDEESGAENIADVDITIESSTDFNYVSQERNIYQRRYLLYVSPRYAGSDSPQMTGENSSHASDPAQEISPSIKEAHLTMHKDGFIYDDSPKSYDYTGSWFDLVLALPYDFYNDNGVVYKNIEYPLRDSSDYTSSINITITWKQKYIIQQNIGYIERDGLNVWYIYTGEQWVDIDDPRAEGIIFKEVSLSIPFAGYSSPIDPEYKETTASLIAMPMPAASQLSLNDGDTGPGHEEDVAEIQFLMNFPKYTGTTTPPQNVWMFLSASPSPFSRNNNGFVLVHQNAGNILTSYNSASYKAYVIDEATGAKVEFDGKAIATDYDPLNKTGNDINYIATHCNIDGNGGIGDYLPHEYDSNAGSNTYHHYHEYQGTVSVEIEDTALKPDGMLAGQYTSEIYIHVMTSD